MPQLFFRPQYEWFLAYLYGPVIPNSSGQLAELIVYIWEDLYNHQILLQMWNSDHIGILAECFSVG